MALTTLVRSSDETPGAEPAALRPHGGRAEILVTPHTPWGAPPNSLPAGGRREVPFEVQTPGTIAIDARFSGGELALILNGPGRLGAFARVDGSGPLSIRYPVAADELAAGTAWRASLVNFSARAAGDVELDIARPQRRGLGVPVVALTRTGAGPAVGEAVNSLAAGATRELFFEVQRVGRIVARVQASGPPLALILNGPGERGYYRRVDGSGEIGFGYDVTAADLARGTSWRLRLVNFGARDAAEVALELSHPALIETGHAGSRGRIVANPLTPLGTAPNSLPAGARRELAFAVRRPGRIEVDVRGSGAPLAVVLNGPGRVGYYARVDGPGPLALGYQVGVAEVRQGPSWRLSVVNFSGTPARGVEIDLRYPTVVHGIGP